MSQLSDFDPASYFGGGLSGLTPGNTPEGSLELNFILPDDDDEPPLEFTPPSTASTIQPAPPVETNPPNQN